MRIRPENWSAYQKEEHQRIFTDVPGSICVIKHKTQLADVTPIRLKAYRISYALRQTLKKGITDLLIMGGIRDLKSSYASSVIF